MNKQKSPRVTLLQKPSTRNVAFRSTMKLPQISIGTMNFPTRLSEHFQNSRLHTKTREGAKGVVKERPTHRRMMTEKTMPSTFQLNSPKSERDEGESFHKALFPFRRTILDTVSLRQSRKTSPDNKDEKFDYEKKISKLQEYIKEKQQKKKESLKEDDVNTQLSTQTSQQQNQSQLQQQQIPLNQQHQQEQYIETSNQNINHQVIVQAPLNEIIEQNEAIPIRQQSPTIQILNVPDDQVDEIRPKKESQSIRAKQESVSSQFTQVTDEIHSVFDNVDLYMRGVQFDEFESQTIQSFLMLYKMRSGGFPGQRENLANEEVIKRAVDYSRVNKQVFKKYFPSKQVVFENEEDYSQNYDVNRDQNYQKFEQYRKKYNDSIQEQKK